MPGLFYYPNGSQLGAGREITSLPWLLKGISPTVWCCAHSSCCRGPAGWVTGTGPRFLVGGCIAQVLRVACGVLPSPLTPVGAQGPASVCIL